MSIRRKAGLAVRKEGATVKSKVRRSVMVAALTGALGIGATGIAHASFDGGGASAWSACTTTWNWNPYGAQGFANEHWTGDTSSGSFTVNGGAGASVQTYDCGPSGYAVNAAQIDLTVKFFVPGSSLSSCSLGLPANISCTGTSTLDVFSITQTCQPDVSSCAMGIGPLTAYPGPGGHFNDKGGSMQTLVTFHRSDGQTYPFSTIRN
jgi:hypothetical protein